MWKFVNWVPGNKVWSCFNWNSTASWDHFRQLRLSTNGCRTFTSGEKRRTSQTSKSWENTISYNFTHGLFINFKVACSWYSHVVTSMLDHLNGRPVLAQLEAAIHLQLSTCGSLWLTYCYVQIEACWRIFTFHCFLCFLLCKMNWIGWTWLNCGWLPTCVVPSLCLFTGDTQSNMVRGWHICILANVNMAINPLPSFVYSVWWWGFIDL